MNTNLMATIVTRATAAFVAALIGWQLTAAAAGELSCNDAVGAAQAATYVRQCAQVSPATHPPCNATNSCALIIAEIRRGCAFIGVGAPSFCAAYK
jgi:hypothetical protein